MNGNGDAGEKSNKIEDHGREQKQSRTGTRAETKWRTLDRNGNGNESSSGGRIGDVQGERIHSCPPHLEGSRGDYHVVPSRTRYLICLQVASSP